MAQITTQNIREFSPAELLGRMSEAPVVIYAYAMRLRGDLASKMLGKGTDKKSMRRIIADYDALLSIVRRYYARYEGGSGVAGYNEKTGRLDA